jgi:predicted house-cleaning noncanonical NTP pyrophosphatase (MazG superfamily)
VDTTDFILLAVVLAVGLFFSIGEGVAVSDKETKVPDDRLDGMWDQQEAFMRLLQEKRGFPDFPTDLTSKKGQQFLKDIRNHLMEELFEAGQHLKNAKSHRATEIPEVDREAYMEELVDALHLYLELVIASGITKEELFEAYMKKGNVNFDRIKNGY